MCPQMNVYLNNFEVNGNEDCLYLNVYTSQVNTLTMCKNLVDYFISEILTF